MDNGLDANMELAQQGDHEAFRLLMEQHTRAVYKLAYRMSGNQHDAEDLTQETFLRAWKHIGRFDGRATFATWLYRICSNCALDHHRSTNRRPAGIDDEAIFNRIASTEPSPERLAVSSQAAARLGPAMEELSGMERIAFVMRHYEGAPVESIAQALGIREGAAKHAIFRAVQKISRAMEPAVSTK